MNYRIYSRNSRTFLTKILYLNLGWVEELETNLMSLVIFIT